jgi:hypothetical protein
MKTSSRHLAANFFLTSCILVAFLLFNGLGCNSSNPTELQSLSTPGLAATLQGEVRSAATGANLPGIILVLENGFDNYVATTDGRGVFRFENVNPGKYRLTAGGAGYVTQNRSILLENDETQNVSLDLAPLVGTGTLAGTVVRYSSTGSTVPLTNVVVTFPFLGLGYLTTAAGTFNATNIPAGMQLVRFSLAGYREMEAYVEIPINSTLTRTFEMLDLAGTIKGTITGAPSSNPLTGAMVAIPALGLTTVTAADGTYTLSRVTSGLWPVEIAAASYDPLTITTTVRSSDITTLDVQLSYSTGTIRGIVRQVGGGPISGATISVPTSGLTSTTNGAGEYLFADSVRTGIFIAVGSSAPGFITSGTYTNLNPGATQVVDFIMTASVGDVTGTVRTTGTGVPIVGAACTITHMGLTSITNASGVYFFDDVPQGYVPITVSATGYQTITTGVPNVAGTTTSTDIFLPAAP